MNLFIRTEKGSCLALSGFPELQWRFPFVSPAIPISTKVDTPTPIQLLRSGVEEPYAKAEIVIFPNQGVPDGKRKPEQSGPTESAGRTTGPAGRSGPEAG